MSTFRMTFSLASLILIFALAAMPAMAEPMLSGTWSTDLSDDGDTTAPATDTGWAFTLVYATAPATGSDPVVTATSGTPGAITPTADGTATTFMFNLPLTDAATDATITVTNFRRVTLKNGLDLAATTIATPKLRSITAPMATNQFFDAVITFEAPAPAVTTPATPEIGPSDGLMRSDVNVTGGTILSFSGGPMMYTVVVSPTAPGTNVVVSVPTDTGGNNTTVFPRQAPA